MIVVTLLITEGDYFGAVYYYSNSIETSMHCVLGVSPTGFSTHTKMHTNKV